MAKVVIIGAGLTGLSAAYHLEQRGFTDYKLFEKESDVGGLCRSVYQDGFTFDYTGHLLHASDDYFRELLGNVVGLNNFNSIVRRSYIYSHDTYTNYPYQVNLFGLPTEVIVDCIQGYAERPYTTKKPKNFYEWAHVNFGAGIAKHFFYPYQSKIFAYDLKQISTSWMGRFVPNTSLKQMIEGAIKAPEAQSIGYNANFYYPKHGGIQFWIEQLAHAVSQEMYTEFTVTHINVKEKYVDFANGHREYYETLITSMPLDIMLKNLKDAPDTNFQKAADKLDCNSVINLNWGFNRPDISEKHWIYFPEDQYPFYRIGFPHNFAEGMAPQGCSSLYAEFAHVKKSARYVQQKLQATRDQIKKVFKVSNNEIATEAVLNISHAYVLYTPWREKNLAKLHKRLQEHDIHSVGRYGEWKYSSMQEAVLDGKKVAEQVTILPAQKTFYQGIPMQKKSGIKELQ